MSTGFCGYLLLAVLFASASRSLDPRVLWLPVACLVCHGLQELGPQRHQRSLGYSSPRPHRQQYARGHQQQHRRSGLRREWPFRPEPLRRRHLPGLGSDALDFNSWIGQVTLGWLALFLLAVGCLWPFLNFIRIEALLFEEGLHPRVFVIHFLLGGPQLLILCRYSLILGPYLLGLGKFVADGQLGTLVIHA